MENWSLNQLIEQLRDIYCGRSTYDSDQDWIDNVNVIMAILCERFGLDFKGV